MSSFDNLYRYKAFKIFGVIFADRGMHSYALTEAVAIYGEAVVEKAIDEGHAVFGFVFQERHDYNGCLYDNRCAMDIKPVWHGLDNDYRAGDGNYGDVPFGNLSYSPYQEA